MLPGTTRAAHRIEHGATEVAVPVAGRAGKVVRADALIAEGRLDALQLYRGVAVDLGKRGQARLDRVLERLQSHRAGCAASRVGARRPHRAACLVLFQPSAAACWGQGQLSERPRWLTKRRIQDRRMATPHPCLANSDFITASWTAAGDQCARPSPTLSG